MKSSTVALLFVSFQVALLGQPEQWVSPSQGRPADCATAQQSEHAAVSGPETQGEAGVLRGGGDVSAPKLASQVRPEYSQEAAVSLYEGTAVLSVVVQPDGTVRDIKVVKPLGLGLDEKAVETVKQWRFQPAKKNSKPVAVQVSVEVDFRLFDPADFESTKRIAERGDAFGQESLGVAYQLGRGTRQNMKNAIKWYRLAAGQGNGSAMCRLGDNYGDGRGVSQDYVQAYMWYSLAADNGVPFAEKARARVESQMTPSQVAEAQTLARNWKLSAHH